MALLSLLAFSLFATAQAAEVPSTTGVTASVDACATLIPAALGARLTADLAAFRLPASDDAGERVREIAARGDWPCPFVVVGDFDGNGWMDRALLLPAKSGASARLVAALNAQGQWQVSLSEDWPLALDATELRPLESGLYQRSDALAQPAAQFDQMAILQAEFSSFRIGKPGAEYNIYAMVNNRWQKLAMPAAAP